MADREVLLTATTTAPPPPPPHHTFPSASPSTIISIAESSDDEDFLVVKKALRKSSDLRPVEIELTPSRPPHTSASASTSTDQDSGYDVFINHRGPDVKNTFASHLYRRLLQRGIRVFLDKPELQEGLNFTYQIQAAIRTASVHVAIFSPRYAQSKWCLDELIQMFASGAPIIPLFYHVKPSQLRSTKGEGGVYSQDLRKLEEKKTYDTQSHEEKPRHDPATIQKWREALASVAEISGFELDSNYTDEGELLDKIVERVMKNVKRKRSDEAPANDSEESTTLLEKEEQQRGEGEVLCDSIGNVFVSLLRLVFLICFATVVGSLVKDFINSLNDPGRVSIFSIFL